MASPRYAYADAHAPGQVYEIAYHRNYIYEAVRRCESFCECVQHPLL